MALKKTPKEESPIDRVRRRIVQAGYWCQKVEHIFPPLGVYRETEVWFWGRESVRTSAPAERLTAYIPSDPSEPAVIGVDW